MKTREEVLKINQDYFFTQINKITNKDLKDVIETQLGLNEEGKHIFKKNEIPDITLLDNPSYCEEIFKNIDNNFNILLSNGIKIKFGTTFFYFYYIDDKSIELTYNLIRFTIDELLEIQDIVTISDNEESFFKIINNLPEKFKIY